MPGRGHALTIDSGWREVADTALAFVQRFTQPPASHDRTGRSDETGPTEGALMDLNLAGKVAVVTGAGKGIGLAVTRALADEGAQVVAGSLHH